MQSIAYFIVFLSILTSFEVKAQSSSSKIPDANVENKIEGNATPPAAKDASKIERVEVTGSFIRRIDVEGPSPTTVLGKEKFKQTGNNTVNELLRDNVNFEHSSTTPSSGYGGKSEGYVRFRGQHAGNTLILLNGMRLPKENGSFYTSTSYIPAAAVERIEILKDGASAVYGSDAMAGVVNFITKKTLAGGVIDTQYNISQRGFGQMENYNIGYGGNFEKVNIMGTIQYQKNNPYFETDLGSYNQSGKYVMSSAGYGNFNVTDANGKVTKSSYGPDCANGTECKSSTMNLSQVQSQLTDVSAMLTGRYEGDNGFEVSLMSLYNHRDNLGIGGPLGVTLQNEKASEFVGGSNQNKVLGKVTGASLVSGSISPNGDLGAYVTNKLTDTVTNQAQVKAFLSDTWDIRWQSSYSYQGANYKTLSGDADKAQLIGMTKTGVYQLGQPGNSLDAILAYPTRRYSGQMINSRLITSGELTEFFEGSISAAFGSEIEYESFAFNHDDSVVQGNLLSGQAFNFSGFRRNLAAFAEMTISPLTNTEIQLAVRSDNYSDMGSTINPKLAIAVRPDKASLIRASFSTGFKPPGVSDPSMPTNVQRTVFRDELATDPKNNTVEKDVVVKANDKISYETGMNFSYGAAVEFTKNLTVSLDQWNYFGKGSISDMGANLATYIEKNQGVASLEAAGGKIIRDPVTNEITYIQVPNVFNRYKKELHGLDFSLSWVNNYKSFRYGIDSTMLYIFNRKDQNFSFVPVQDWPDYGTQVNNSIYLSSAHHYYRLGVRTLLNGDATARIQSSLSYNYPVYTEFDFTYSYTAHWDGKFTVGVRNLLDSTPYINYDADQVRFSSGSSLFSPLKRRFFLGYSQTF